MSGRDGYGDLGGALTQIRSASEEASGRNGLDEVSRNVHAELSDRVIGSAFAILMIVSLLSLMTEYAVPVIASCAAVAVLLGLVAVRRRARTEKLRDMQLRVLAEKKMQEDETNA
jgi:hypothetical protein